jgi:NAD(P)-dependent dehydrogenase (short-subunit alcohol dehydrogenase family)
MAEPTRSVLDLFRLDGKVVIVTGASSGLGVAFAEALADAGADLLLAGRRPVEHHGQLVVAARAVGVRTERVVESGT